PGANSKQTTRTGVAFVDCQNIELTVSAFTVVLLAQLQSYSLESPQPTYNTRPLGRVQAREGCGGERGGPIARRPVPDPRKGAGGLFGQRSSGLQKSGASAPS